MDNIINMIRIRERNLILKSSTAYSGWVYPEMTIWILDWLSPTKCYPDVLGLQLPAFWLCSSRDCLVKENSSKLTEYMSRLAEKIMCTIKIPQQCNDCRMLFPESHVFNYFIGGCFSIIYTLSPAKVFFPLITNKPFVSFPNATVMY